jgi:hypothetical protein
MASDSMMYMPTFMKIGFGIHVLLSYGLDNLRGRIVGITNGKDLSYIPLTNLRSRDTFIASFMTIRSGIGAILRALPQQFERL